MNTAIKIVETAMYLLSAFGIGIALSGIALVVIAFVKKQDRLLQDRFAEKHNEFLQRKQRVDAVLKKN